MELRVSRSALAAIREHARIAAPDECCGLLLGEGEEIILARPTCNLSPEPVSRFEIDPQALVDAHRASRSGGSDLVGYYHSHPRGRAAPSPTDQGLASGDGRVWAITSEGDVTFWRDDEAGFAPLSYVVVDR